MADSDPEYISDDDVGVGANGAGKSTSRNMASRPKGRAQARWEAAVESTWQLHEGADGDIQGVLGGLEEAGKRKRYASVTRLVMISC